MESDLGLDQEAAEEELAGRCSVSFSSTQGGGSGNWRGLFRRSLRLTVSRICCRSLRVSYSSAKNQSVIKSS